MAVEIERKFLVLGNNWRQSHLCGVRCIQGYLTETAKALVRIRIAGEKGFLAVKARKAGIARFEYEYEILVADALEILDTLCEKPLIEKVRYEVQYEGKRWEIDVFENLNQGLVVAEIELTQPEEPFRKPPWAGLEVTDDPKYLNVNLARCPFRSWPPSV